MILEFDSQALSSALKNSPPGILDGRAVSNVIINQLQPVVRQFGLREIHPALSVLQVGDDEASNLYIKRKLSACGRLGIRSHHHSLAADTSFPEVMSRLRQINADPMIHGVLVQLPLPPHMDSSQALQSIASEKDIDGFHPVNLGCLMTRQALLEPCTPRGVLTLLRAAGIDPTGQEAVVVGRSVIVGRPMGAMLTRADATVTICHRHTRDLEAAVRRADILVVATGVAELVKGDWIKEGAVVIDVGISRQNGELCGDVEFESAKERASWITPVPGGVGPMTVATLMANTIRAACIQEEYVVRDGRVVPTEEVDLHYHRVDGLGITELRQGARMLKPMR